MIQMIISMVEDSWRKEFENCKTAKDYEKYIYKYYEEDNNPFLGRAKARLHQISKYKFRKKLLIFTLTIIATIIINIPLYLYEDTSVFEWIFVDGICGFFLFNAFLFLIKN